MFAILTLVALGVPLGDAESYVSKAGSGPERETAFIRQTIEREVAEVILEAFQQMAGARRRKRAGHYSATSRLLVDLFEKPLNEVWRATPSAPLKEAS